MADERRLDRQYLDLAGHLKACLAFERFHHRLRRGRAEHATPPRRSPFLSAYSELQSIAAELDSGDQRSLASRLSELENRLHQEAVRLGEVDRELGPGEVRRFVRRGRRLDGEVLLELLHFYVFAWRRRAWDADLTDKVDFLMSRMGEEVSGPSLSQDRVRLRASLQYLWRLAQARPIQAAVIAALTTEIEEVGERVATFASLDDLRTSGTIERYREIKHGVGPMFVEPSVALAILETNLELGRKVQNLYDLEEDVISEGLSRLEEIEASAGFSEFMSLELDSLRLDIERLGEGREQDDVRIDTVRRLREQAEVVLSRLEEIDAVDPAETSDGPPPARSASPDDEGDLEVLAGDALASDLLERLIGQLESLLIATGTLEQADSVLQDPGLPLDLERREIEAFLLLRDESSPDAALDRRLLSVASLRQRLSILHDHLAAGVSGLAELEAAAALDLAEEFLLWFREVVAELESGGPTNESAEIRFLEVRLMNAYSSLWLEVNGEPRPASA